MFFTGEAFVIFTVLLVVALLLLSLALVAHVVWLRRLAGSDMLGRLGPMARMALLMLAAATPVISFYGVGTAVCLRRLARHHGVARAAKTVLGIVVAIGVAVLGLLVLEELHPTVPGPHGPDVVSRLPGMLVVLAIPCAIFGMACQVLVRSNLVRAGCWIVAGAAVAGLFLLI